VKEFAPVRLYLSSFRLGCCPERLAELARGGTRAVVIANATDFYPAEGRSEAVTREVDALCELGFRAAELDLRDHFDGDAVEDELQRGDLVWVRGGDVFTLRYSLARSGADRVLSQLIEADAVAYGGYSAGVCVLAPTLRGLEDVDDPSVLRGLHDADPIWDGLGVLDYSIVPHVDSPDHPEGDACDRLATRYRAAGTPHRTLRDGEVLIIDGDEEQLCSG
jgi:dipeptidase E